MISKNKYKQTKIGEIPDNWDIKIIDDVFNVFAGGDLEKINYCEIKSKEFIFPVYSNSLRSKGLYGYSDKYQYEPDCVTITARGDVGKAECRVEPFNAIVRLLVLKPKIEVSCKFVASYINTVLKFQKVGAAVNQLTAPMISNRYILYPPIKEQLKIASIISTYDDLIEKNEKRINILEEMAQLLYTEWFVKFKFPGHKKVKLVDSGTEFGIIPKGWAVKKLSEIGRVITGKTPPTSNPENLGGDVLFIKTPDMHGNIFVIETEQTLSEKGVKTQFSKLLPDKTVFVSCIGTLGVVGITSVPSQTNQQINSLVLNDMSDYCMFYFFAKSLRQKLVGLGSNGATMGNVNKGKFENIEIVYPSEAIRKDFYNRTNDVFDEILCLQKQIKNLSKIRDLLTPELITGKRELK